MQVSVVIPVAPYHKVVLERAIKSVQAQTVACKIMYLLDVNERGAGWTRNRIIEQVDTPYIVFLDADDWLEPTFIELCLNAIEPGRYAYTDWYKDATEIVQAPTKPWCNGTWHTITTLLHTSDVKRLGGFDETLPALEDTDFFLKLTTNQVCGIHVERPLMHYSKDGLRSKLVHESGEVETLRKHVLERYKNQMGCCGDKNDYDNTTPVGEKQDGDVMAMAMWAGNKRTFGKATGRRYPRMSYPKKTWVHPSDVAREPHLWQRISEPVPVAKSPTVTDVVQYQDFGGVIDGMKDLGVIRTPPPPPRPLREDSVVAPDVSKVLKLGQRKS